MSREARTVYLLLSSVSAFFFTTVFTVNLVYQLQVAHLNPLQLVLVGTVLEMTIFLTQVPTGVLADVYSRRRLAVILGLAVMGAGSLLEGSIPQFWAILVSQVLWGVGVTFTDGADSAMKGSKDNGCYANPGDRPTSRDRLAMARKHHRSV